MKNTYCDKLTIYLDEETKKLIPKAKEIFSRENSSISEWFRKTLTEYVKLHEPGNPQQRLDTIMDLGKPYNAHKCNMCDARPAFQCFVGKNPVLLCETHFESQRKRLSGWKKTMSLFYFFMPNHNFIVNLIYV